MMVENFESIWQRACERKGGSQALEMMISTPLTNAELAQLDDARWLSQMTKSIFQSGFVWRVIDNKWPDFERAFFGFNPQKMLLLDESHIERLANDASIVRNRQKIITVPVNARMVVDLAQQYGSFSQFISQWPEQDIVGLWRYLKKHGARLGGNTASYVLRQMGKDTFILSKDVVGYFCARQVITKAPTSQRDLNLVQLAFNDWQQQSQLSLTAISQVVAYSCGENN